MAADRQGDIDKLIALMPYGLALGIRLREATAEVVRGSLDWSAERCTTGGVLHGGALMSLADATGGISAYLNLPGGASTTTVESKTNFFRAVRAGAVHATSRPLHAGRSFIVVQTDLVDDEDRRVSLTLQTQAVLRPTA
ncbi:PaaI family thioesterase [Phytohabitans houttuyneae]|uniref:Aromatic compound degradation protein PaaI n=1 Tax=Phytohabitans houttuyneae TaxID=1076126 RepID=A0A6V8KDB0_9ACTN|nr:PaaI family thioesterase [Phytohabitans houttuyneae]GFJ81430.1 aromatic compound degradation protein PaaI [Phytohabitans houttuyneae]